MAALPVEPAHQHVFELDELLDAMARAFAADAGFLHAPERRELARNRAGVDADHAVFERFGDPPHPAQIARVEVGREAELRVVGFGDDVSFVLEAEDRRDRTEGLLARDQHRRIDVRQ